MSKKFFMTIIFLLIVIMSITNVSFAADAIDEKNMTGFDVIDNLAEWIVDNDITSEKIQSRAQIVMGIVNVVGVISSVVVLMILGIKYMSSSIEEKAEYKKTFIYYVLGAVLLFVAPTLANIVYNISIQVTTV